MQNLNFTFVLKYIPFQLGSPWSWPL